MASECSVADQSLNELTGVKKLGDDTKEEEKHEPEDGSVADEINKEEEHEHVSSSAEPAVETNEGKSNDVVEILTSKEPVNSALKQENLKAAEVAQTFENEIKVESSYDETEIEIVESEDSKDDVHELVHTEVPVVVFPDVSEVPEEIDVVDRSSLTSISVPVKNLEAETGSPEEHIPEESAETKADIELIKSEDANGDVHELFPAEISAVDSEAREENNVDSITLTTIEVPLKDPESYSVSHEEKKLEVCGETKEHDELSRSEDSKEEVHELVPTEVSINSDVGKSTHAIVEVPVKDFEVESGSPEELKTEVGAESEVKKLIKLGDSKEEGQELASEEVPTDISEAPKKNDVELSTPTSTELPLKDLEVESGSPEEQKLEESAETKVDVELIKSGKSKVEGQDLVSGEVPTDTSEAPEKNDVDLSAATSTVVLLKNIEVESSSPEEQKPKEGAETKANIELIEPDDSKVEGREFVSTEVPTSASEVSKVNDVDLSTPTSTKVPVNDLEIESGSPDKQKPEEGPETKVKIELMESGDSKIEGQDPVFTEVCTNTSEELEKIDVDSSTPTSIEVPVKDLEVESGSPVEQKLEESAETKVNIEFIKSGESKDEGQDLFSGEVSTNTYEVPEINDVELSIPTSTEVHVKDLEVNSSSTVEQKLEEIPETKVVIDLIESGDSKDEGQESVSSKVSTNISEEPENNNVDSSSSTSIEVPVKDLEVESGSPEEQKIEESAVTRVDTDFIKSGELKDEGQDSGEVSTISSEAPEINDVDLSIPTSTEVHVKDLEIDSSSIEEQKLEEDAETKIIYLIESGDSKDEGQQLVSSKVSTNTSEESENNNVGSSSSTSIEVPVKDLEVESGSPEEQKIEESAETEVNTDFIKLGESKDEGQDSGEVPASSSEAPEIDDVDLSIPTSTEVPVNDLEVESTFPEEQKPEVESGDSKVEGQESVSAEVPTSTSEEPENNIADLSTKTSIEVPVKDLEFESGSPEEKILEGSAKIEVNTDFIKSEESTDAGQDLVSGEVPINTSKATEIKDVNLSAPTSTEVPMKDLEVESGFPEEQKPEDGAETKVNIEFIETGDSKVVDQELVSSEVHSSTSEAPKITNVDLSTTSTEVLVNDLEIESGSLDERKSKEGPETKVNIELIESGDSTVEGQGLVSAKVPSNTSEESENNDVDSSTPTSTEVPVKDLEVELGSPEEQKSEVNIKLESDDSKVEGQKLVSGVVSDNISNAPGKEDVELSTPTSMEAAPVKDLEVESGSPEEQKLEESAKTNVDIKSITPGDSKDEGQGSVYTVVPTNTSEERENNNVDLSSINQVPAKNLEVESGFAEEQNPKESVETIEPSSDVTTIVGGGEVAGSSSYEEKSPGVGEVVDKEDEGLKEEVIQTRIEEDQTTDEDDVSEAVTVKKDDEIVEDGIEGSTDLDVVSQVTEVLPGKVIEEKKDKNSEVENTETAPKVSGVSLVGGNVLEKDVNVEAIERDLAETSIDSTVGGVSTEQAKNPVNVDVEPLELKFEELDVSPEASEVPSVREIVFEGGEKSESSKGGERKDKISEVDNTDNTPNVSGVSSAVGNVLEKDVIVEAMERDLVEISSDSTIAEVSSEQAKSPGIVGEKLSELKSKEHYVSPEASEVPSVGERVSTGDEKSESLKGESLAHLSGETPKSESSKCVTEASVENFPEAVKEIIASESYSEKKNETSRDLSLEEKNVNLDQDKKDEMKVEGVIENAPEHEELGIEKKDIEKPKDEEPIVSSNTRDVKLVKEAAKRESNIFAKMKRSIVKAKKAILGKSPGPKTVSSESKDVNI